MNQKIILTFEQHADIRANALEKFLLNRFSFLINTKYGSVSQFIKDTKTLWNKDSKYIDIQQLFKYCNLFHFDFRKQYRNFCVVSSNGDRKNIQKEILERLEQLGHFKFIGHTLVQKINFTRKSIIVPANHQWLCQMMQNEDAVKLRTSFCSSEEKDLINKYLMKTIPKSTDNQMTPEEIKNLETALLSIGKIGQSDN